MLPGSNVKIHVRRNEFRRYVDIVPVIHNEAEGRTTVGYIKDGQWLMKQFRNGAMIPEEIDGAKFLSIPECWCESLRDSLIEELGRKRPDATEQELLATKYHLEDMRILVFGKKRGTPQ